MEDTDSKPFLPVHVNLGVAEYCKVKTSKPQLISSVRDPVAEFTQFGWTIASQGFDTSLDKMFLALTDQSYYKELCRMDILGLQDTSVGDQNVVHEDLLEQLKRDSKELRLVRKLSPLEGGSSTSTFIEANSLKSLGTLVQRLKKDEGLDEYDAIIQARPT